MCLTAQAYPSSKITPATIVYQIEKNVMNDSERFAYTKQIIDQSMDFIINTLAFNALTEKGENRLAQQLSNEWSYNLHRSLFSQERDIGEHPEYVISKWVHDSYFKIEEKLGHEFCVQSHIAAMLTFNDGAKVVINPCVFPMDNVKGERKAEYSRNFSGYDSRFNGVVPEACYFAMAIACAAGTSGLGSVVCSFAAGIAERMIAEFVAPQLSDYVFDKSCSRQRSN